MKNRTLKTGLLILALVAPSPVLAQRRGHSAQSGNGGKVAGAHSQGAGLTSPSGGIGTITGGLDSTSLSMMWEEEKLARDVYIRLGESFKLRVFSNISQAEQQHMRALEGLLSSSGIDTSRLDSTPGVFVYPKHQELFAALVAMGMQSPLDAVRVGAKIEELDIADLRQLLSGPTTSRQRQVLQQLIQGSQNHLRAFTRQIAQSGSTYMAEYLPQAEFDEIVQGGSGRGNGSQAQNGRGAGRGRGMRGQRG
ncbi:MAG: DUF2202 domain-containing protein [Planctomycetales bacterium]|nr:DUF2202 domain-containing protein [Planctomycetales bacterium]